MHGALDLVGELLARFLPSPVTVVAAALALDWDEDVVLPYRCAYHRVH